MRSLGSTFSDCARAFRFEQPACGRLACKIGAVKPACRTLAPNGDPGDRSSELAWRAPRTPFSYFWEVVSARDSPPDSGHLFQLDIGRPTRRVTRWLSAIPAAPPSGCHAPVGAGMPTRMPDSGIHSADGGSRIRLLDGWGSIVSYDAYVRRTRPLLILGFSRSSDGRGAGSRSISTKTSKADPASHREPLETVGRYYERRICKGG